MAKLPLVSGAIAAKAFSKAGWITARQTGSHLIMVKQGCMVTLSVPMHSEIYIMPFFLSYSGQPCAQEAPSARDEYPHCLSRQFPGPLIIIYYLIYSFGFSFSVSPCLCGSLFARSPPPVMNILIVLPRQLPRSGAQGLFVGQGLPPAFIFRIPPDGVLNPLLEAVQRLPSQLPA